MTVTTERDSETRWYEVDRDGLHARAAHPLSSLPRPILRWAGSKQRLLPSIIDVLPAKFGTYYEPFLGSGALFFLLEPHRAMLTDVCAPLLDVYKAIKANPEDVHQYLGAYDTLDSAMYYEVRAQTGGDESIRAARFIYLNRACWNGLYRVNKKGQFNVPYGAPKTSSVPDAKWIESCATALRRPDVAVEISDFADAVSTAERGDLVFFDPPYVTGHNNNGFVDYNEDLFRWSDQERLAETARELRSRGVHVIITNADHEAIRALYPDFTITEISRKSTLASNKNFRRSVTEALIHTGQ